MLSNAIAIRLLNDAVQLVEISDIDDLLLPERPLVAELRWLQLLLHKDQQLEDRAAKMVQMRAKRQRSQKDEELPYHPIVLAILQVTASMLLLQTLSLSRPIGASMLTWPTCCAEGQSTASLQKGSQRGQLCITCALCYFRPSPHGY